MRWEDVKKTFPQQWVIVEAVEAHTEGDQRIIENLQMVEFFGEDNNGALRQYVQLHKVHPEKEYYVVHTLRPELNVKQRNRTGAGEYRPIFKTQGFLVSERAPRITGQPKSSI